MVLSSSYRRKRNTFKKRRRMGGPLTMTRRRRPMTTTRVKKIIGAELKFRQNNFRDNLVNAATPLIPQMTNVPQGDGNDEREGNRITPVNIHGHVTVTGEAAADDITDVRVAILRWNEDFSVNPPVTTEIMEDVTNLGSSYNINNRGQFKILWSRYFTIVNNADNPSFRRTLRFYVKLSGPKILFDGATSKKYHLFFMILSNSADAATPTVTLNSTFRYTDS